MSREILTLLGAVFAGSFTILLTGWIARPKSKADVQEINVRIAGDLRDDAVESWQLTRTEMRTLREDFDKYRDDTDARLAEQAVQVRAARAGEAEALRKADAYLERLTKAEGRVTELETEVANLKANGTPRSDGDQPDL